MCASIYIQCSRSLHCMKTYKIFVLYYDMYMILESLESDFKCTLINTKISQIACWEHIEQKKNNTHCNGISAFDKLTWCANGTVSYFVGTRGTVISAIGVARFFCAN